MKYYKYKNSNRNYFYILITILNYINRKIILFL